MLKNRCGRKAGQQGGVGLELLQRHEPHAEFIAQCLQCLILADNAHLDQ